MPQSQNGSTINGTIKVVNGVYSFTFADPFNMLINLYNSNAIITVGSKNNDKFNLLNSSGLTINGGNGNNIYNVSAATASLNGDKLVGGTGMDFVTLSGSNSVIDLTQGSSGIEAVVGSGLPVTTGGPIYGNQTVTVSLNQMLGSKLTNGGTGRAFAAVLGTDGKVNVVLSRKFKLVGEVNAAKQGFDASGNAITGAALTTLLGQVTSVSSITGNLASLYAGSTNGTVPTETEVSQAMSAYVFSDGVKNYTVWTDGTVTPISAAGEALTPAYHPTAVAPAATSYSSVGLFNKTSLYAGANLYADADSTQNLRLTSGNTHGASAVVTVGGASGIKIHGDAGDFGANYFGLGGSGGNNIIYGSKAGNTFDLVNSTALQDVLVGTKGYDIVKASANGADVDLTSGNPTTSHASTWIDAVVGSSDLTRVQTVEVDFGTLQTTKDGSGVNVAVFEAILGGTNDTLTISATHGKWVELATFNPGDPLPTHASALVHGADLDKLFGSATHTTANSLVGHLYEQVKPDGTAYEYVTVYTDATIDNHLTLLL